MDQEAMNQDARAGEPRLFGTLEDGTPVHAIGLAGQGLAVSVLSYGAVLKALAFEGRPTILGLDTLADYAGPSAHLGAVAGRFANRIAGGRLSLDGRVWQLALNEGGRTHLHGGVRGFGRRPWTIESHAPEAVTLVYRAADGEEGYPGALTARCSYAITGPGTLEIRLEATCEAPTIVGLAGHAYFNLDGAGVIDDHVLAIPAESYLPVDGLKIPTGEVAPVAGTRFDLRAARPIGAEAYDHPFVLGEAAWPEPRTAARLVGARSGIALTIASTEPVIQFYTGHMLGEAGLSAGGRSLVARAGLCLEPERFPDAPNQPGFPSAVLRPGETYRQVTRYVFARAG